MISVTLQISVKRSRVRGRVGKVRGWRKWTIRGGVGRVRWWRRWLVRRGVERVRREGSGR